MCHELVSPIESKSNRSTTRTTSNSVKSLLAISIIAAVTVPAHAQFLGFGRGGGGSVAAGARGGSGGVPSARGTSAGAGIGLRGRGVLGTPATFGPSLRGAVAFAMIRSARNSSESAWMTIADQAGIVRGSLRVRGDTGFFRESNGSITANLRYSAGKVRFSNPEDSTEWGYAEEAAGRSLRFYARNEAGEFVLESIEAFSKFESRVAISVTPPPQEPQTQAPFVFRGITFPQVPVIPTEASLFEESHTPSVQEVLRTPLITSAPARGNGWTNTLGMTFVPVVGTEVLFGRWETRVQDFEAFVNATGYDATEGMFSISSDGWKLRGHTWHNPGFYQTPLHPVCGVSWNDAEAFCKWLTKKERNEGKLLPGQIYRLPTDIEWSTAAGTATYPWGDQWPPPSRAGNLAGAESDLPRRIEGFRDDHVRTAPVGSYTPNALGLYDLAGNVWEWCDDWYRKEMNSAAAKLDFPASENDGGGRSYRVLRGGAGVFGSPVRLASHYHNFDPPSIRNDLVGFRCVLVVSGAGR